MDWISIIILIFDAIVIVGGSISVLAWCVWDAHTTSQRNNNDQ